jgi:site-specific recombinase XerD
MKGKNNIQSFEEFKENLNISDVSESKTIGDIIDDNTKDSNGFFWGVFSDTMNFFIVDKGFNVIFETPAFFNGKWTNDVGDYIKSKLSKIENLKHKTILTLTYSVGLRVSEIINLKIEDIDSKRMIIHIKNAKGKKDRIVPLSENVQNLIKIYSEKYTPKEYLFNGQSTNKYSIQSCQNIYKKYIDENSSIHTLRHSAFTNLLENGTDLRIIQKIAGHSSTKTTEIYTHVSNQLLNKVNLPI